jgi:hypothetical protein
MQSAGHPAHVETAAHQRCQAATHAPSLGESPTAFVAPRCESGQAEDDRRRETTTAGAEAVERRVRRRIQSGGCCGDVGDHGEEDSASGLE